MKKFAALSLSLLMAAVLAACSAPTSSFQPEASAPEGDTINRPTSSAVQTSGVPEEETQQAQEANLEDVYAPLAAAAGLEGTIDVTVTDLAVSGGVTTGNILAMVGKRSIMGNDSGMVLVLQVTPGTEETMKAEIENYRDMLVGGPDYEEFAASQEATQNARIFIHENLVIYVAASAGADASYADIDAAIEALHNS